MTTTTMQTIDRRARTSDGTVLCCMCRETIKDGDSYMQDSCADSGILVQRDVCMSCWMAKNAHSFIASISVIAAVTIVLAVFAAALR